MPKRVIEPQVIEPHGIEPQASEPQVIRVEVVYAKGPEQALLSVDLTAGQTAKDAIERSGILGQFSDIDLAVNKIGIFGKLTKLDNPLTDGDRVEIYRPLIADPKEARKRRAAEGKAMRKGAR